MSSYDGLSVDEQREYIRLSMLEYRYPAGSFCRLKLEKGAVSGGWGRRILCGYRPDRTSTILAEIDDYGNDLPAGEYAVNFFPGTYWYGKGWRNLPLETVRGWVESFYGMKIEGI